MWSMSERRFMIFISIFEWCIWDTIVIFVFISFVISNIVVPFCKWRRVFPLVYFAFSNMVLLTLSNMCLLIFPISALDGFIRRQYILLGNTSNGMLWCFCVGSFNVRGLWKHHNKELVKNINRCNIDVTCPQETKIKDASSYRINGSTIITFHSDKVLLEWLCHS